MAALWLIILCGALGDHYVVTGHKVWTFARPGTGITATYNTATETPSGVCTSIARAGESSTTPPRSGSAA